jgi:sigma-B regulation protein RsbU (phosphoserine phosphatase)
MSVTELVSAAIGSTLLALGGASIVAWSLRRRSTDRSLLIFGIWCCLYGTRLVGQQSSIRGTIGGPPQFWSYLTAFATYIINIPGGLFFQQLIGSGWRSSIRRVWQAQIVYAIVAIVTDLVLRHPRAAMGPNRPIVLIGMVIALANLWLFRHRLSPLFKTPAIAVGAMVLVLFVVNENLGRPVAQAINLEPVGVFVFVLCLGYGVVGSVFRNEAELVAVQRELETARQIQTALLPRELPRVRSLDLAVRYIPLAAVAGDLYDFAVLGPARIGILVADVSGHGIPAALVASMVKIAFAAQAEQADDPARVLSAMNLILCSHVERTFVTAIYAVIDSDRGTITFANAGHPPLLIGRHNNHVDESSKHGFMLGFLPAAQYENDQLRLQDGDCVLFYTDGVPETRNPKGEFLDDEGVRSWLAASGGADAERVADSVLRQLRHWRGHVAFDDDVTFVVARLA